jgi:hypothetical protein
MADNYIKKQRHQEPLRFLVFSASLKRIPAKHYPCIKKAWVEYLGEKTDPVTERVE